MSNARFFSVFELAALCLLTFMPDSLSAQSLWLEHSHKRAVDIEILRPHFKEYNYGYSSSAWVIFGSLHWPLSRRTMLLAELPFTHMSSEFASLVYFYPSYSISDNAFGNPYLGLKITGRSDAFTMDIGLRLPIASKDKLYVAYASVYSDYDRLEAFLPRILSLSARANFHYQHRSGLALKALGGPSLWLDTDTGRFEDKFEALFIYSAQTGYASERFSLMGGISGRAFLTASGANFDERTVHQLGFNASVRLGRLKPSAHFRAPLDDDLKRSLDFVLGFNLGVEF